jgi:pilus assembly protein Flp/PilA
MNNRRPRPRAAARVRGLRSSWARSDRGASAVEYGLLIAGIAALIVVIVFAFGDSIGDVLFEDTCQEIVAGTGRGDCV